MNFKEKIAYMASGIIIGGFLMTGITAQANGGFLQNVLWDDSASVYIDNEKQEVAGRYKVLKYDDHYYYPARFIAEGMGGEVDWEEATHNIYITTPKKEMQKPEEKPEKTPEEIEKEKEEQAQKEKEEKEKAEKEKEEKEKEEQKQKDKDYSEVPVRVKKQNVTMTLETAAGYNDLQVGVYIESDTRDVVYVDHRKVYIELDDGTKIKCDPLVQDWRDSVVDTKEGNFIFRDIPKDLKYFKLVAPIKIANEEYEFEYLVKLNNKDR